MTSNNKIKEKLEVCRESCDFDLEINDAMVLFCAFDFDNFDMTKACYLEISKKEISSLIETYEMVMSPFSKCYIRIIFYGHQDDAKKMLRLLKNGGAVTKVTKAKESESNEKEKTNRKSLTSTLIERSEKPGEIVAESSRKTRSIDNSVLTNGEMSSLLRNISSDITKLLARCQSFDETLLQINEKLDKIEEQGTSGELLDSNLRRVDRAMAIIKQKRNDKQWVSKIKKVTFDGLNSEQNKAVINRLISGSVVPSKLVIDLASIVFGEESLRNCILGENGKLNRAPRAFERRIVIPWTEEKILRDILQKLANDDTFTDAEGWKLLVREPINQKGREFKSKARKRNKRDETEPSVSPKQKKDNHIDNHHQQENEMKSNEISNETSTQPPDNLFSDDEGTQ